MRRRKFIKLIGGAAVVWPVTTRAQQVALPVIGFLASASPEANAGRLDAFRQGLRETGYVEGQNVSIEYQWTDGKNGGRMSELAALLVDHRVTVLVAAGGTESAIAAKKATKSVPVVFGIASDPVALELVATLNRPGGNVTGVTSLNIEVAPKRLELLREVLPAVTNIALLLDPAIPVLAEATERVVRAAADAHGMQLHVLHVSNEDELKRAFEDCTKLRIGALMIAPNNFFTARSEQIAQLALRHALPAIYEFRRFAAAGGLMSYGASETEYYRLVGSYAGRILKGDRAADLPVQQATKVELIINLKTAATLGVTIPIPILGRADEVIE